MAKIQNYEEYWGLTNAFTDYNGEKFLATLTVCVDFIDTHKEEEYSEEKYSRLQDEVYKVNPINHISIRKSINQLVKMGFVNSFLLSYHILTKDYLQAKTDRKRKTLLSRIVYDNSSFNRSVTDESSLHQLNFLINTLIENGKLSKSDIIALMLVDIETVEKGFLDREKLNEYLNLANQIDPKDGKTFIQRKYNQVGYLNNILNKLDEICFVNDELYFTEDAKRIFGENLELESKKRDPYLHMLYKTELKRESFAVYQAEKCMVERLDYPVLIASHIKPFIQSNDFEAYDVNNGILLSRNFDSLFDLGYITFDTDGKIVVSAQLSEEVKTHILEYQLDSNFINSKRLEYLDYHRNNVFRKCG